MSNIMTWRFTLSILIKVVKVVVARRFKVLATSREIW
jgi:hypothetical protein